MVELAAGIEPDILHPGAGVCFDEGHPEQDEQGGRVVEVRSMECGMGIAEWGMENTHAFSRDAKRSAELLEVRLFHGSVNLAAVPLGCLVWKTDDPAFRRKMEQSFSRDVVVHREPIEFFVQGKLGEPLQLSVRDAAGNVGEAGGTDRKNQADIEAVYSPSMQ